MNTNLKVVVTETDRQLLDTVCEARGEVMSSFVRRAIRTELARLSYYPPDVKKALGVSDNQGGM